MDTTFSQANTIKPGLLIYLDEARSEKGEPFAAETRKKVVENTRKFFEWCKMEQAAKFRGLPSRWVQKLKSQRKNTPDVQREPEFLLVDEVIQLTNLPGAESDLAHWRDCAMAARLLLTGERASAAVTSPISAIDFDRLSLKQWPELGVKTKNNKKATTFLFNIPELIAVARSWDEFVRAHLPPDAPGSNRNIALNKRLRLLFAQAALPYRSAHKFRHGHAAYGLLHCQTMADYKALSLNLMHESLEITDSIYVHLKLEEQRNRITRLVNQPVGMPDGELEQFLFSISRQNIPNAMKILIDRLSS